MKHLKHALTAALAAVTLVTAVPADATPADATPAGAEDRVGRVTAGLRQAPVFVDPDVSYLLNAWDRAALTQQIKTAGVPVYLAVVPLVSADESNGDADYFTYLLHRRLARNGIYLISDERGTLDWTAYQVPRDDSLEYDQANSKAPLPRRLHDVIDAFAHAPKAAPTDPPTPRAPDADPTQRNTSAVALTGQFTKTFFPSLALSGLALGLLYAIGMAVFRTAGTVRKTRRGPGRLSPRRLRRKAQAELVRLAQAIGRAGEDNPGYVRAMDGYDAAKLLHDEKQDPGSRFAVVVISLEGQDALRTKTSKPEPRCVVNPLHGTAQHRVRRRLPGLPDARRPLCAACERLPKLRPLTLEIRGGRRPYYLAPGLWEKLRGRTSGLSERVLEYLGVE